MTRIADKFRWLLDTLRGYVFTATAGVALLVFFGATLASSLLYEKLMYERSLDVAQEVSRQNFLDIYRALRIGAARSHVDEIIAGNRATFASSLSGLAVYRARKVEESHGAATEPPPPEARKVLDTGRMEVVRSEGEIAFAYPVAAQPKCLSCHANAASGDILGAVVTRHRTQTVTAQVRIYYVGTFLALGVLVLLAAGLTSAVAARRIKRSVDTFRAKVESVNTVKDFDIFDISRVDFGFREFNQTFDDVALLVEKMKCVAVDKDVLEFEIKLLEKFIITSNVVRDWRQFIKSLLLDINPIIDAYALVTIFRVEEEAYECEIFWRGKPQAATARSFEEALHSRLLGNPIFAGATIFDIVHNVADENATLPEMSTRDIDVQTKSLLLDTPKIGGIVGIGVQSPLALDNVRQMVIGSILTTLLNLVGSVKAIYKYTKDLEHYATRDPLTNLYNQRMFWELLGYEVGRAKRHEQSFAVMMLDMDNFKSINDRYGHHFGDAFLCEFAKVLHSAVREGDLLARYGGDEFCVILPEATDTQAHMVAQRIAEMLDEFSMETPDRQKVKATTSIGIAICPTHGDNPKDLFLIADNMMYKAKQAGKNNIAIPSEDEMAEVFRKAGEKVVMIQNALDQKLIVPYFQPICRAADCKVVIHELLMRIQQGDNVVAAHEFIEEAENMGIAHKMDYQLIEKAFAQIKEQNYDGMLFVNLSPRALIVGEYVGRVSRLAEEFGIDPSRIVFEITERETVSNLSLLEKFVMDVKMRGFSFAIDDFGSGYSSFQYIKCFPIDYIKIEGEFIQHMVSDPVYHAFVKSIVTLAKELGVKTIAEYVENEEVLSAVEALGIDFAQGYHISRPGPQFQRPSLLGKKS